MKKIFSILAIFTLLVAMLAACNPKDAGKQTEPAGITTPDIPIETEIGDASGTPNRQPASSTGEQKPIELPDVPF